MSERWGLIARCDHRGLGYQTYDFWRENQPARTLVILLGDKTPYAEHVERFPGGPGSVMIARWENGELPVMALEWLLTGVDQVYAAETVYDDRLFDMAHARGVSVMVHVNPELYGSSSGQAQNGSQVILPSPWLRDRFNGAALRRVATPADAPIASGDKVVHVVGHPAAADRAGTQLVTKAFAALSVEQQERCEIWTQQPLRFACPKAVRILVGDREDRYAPYRQALAVVQPRRYGGLSMILEEALACRVPAMIATARDPDTWYALRFKETGLDAKLAPIARTRQIRVVGTQVPHEICSVEGLVHALRAVLA